MKKTLLSLITLLTTTIALASVKIDNIYYNLNDENKTAEVTYQYNNNYSNYSNITSITIPSTISFNNTEYRVTSIGDCAFQYSALTSITINNNITSIKDRAFMNCPSLISITIPNSVTYIGNEVFRECFSLISITIPNSITYIGINVFDYTPWLNNLPDGCLYVGKCLYLYKGNKSINHIDIKEGTTMICNNAFSYCGGLSSLQYPIV